MSFIGAIEAGGTKFICGIFNLNGALKEKREFKTETPNLTIPKIKDFLKEYEFKALGIASFGPLSLDKNSKDYGKIAQTTPKVHWAGFNFIEAFKSSFNVPIAFDTDVNSAALAEAKKHNLESILYLTVGTGIGGGFYSNGHLLHGLLHSEMGHLIVKKHPQDNFEGVCPYHSDCLEGLASGVAIYKRWGLTSSHLEETHFGLELEAYYLAQALRNYILTLSPNKIILGGGVMKAGEKLIEKVRVKTQESLNSYINHPLILKDIKHYISFPFYKDDAGLQGAFWLAKMALEAL